MIDGLKRYSEYRGSGGTWLGQVPEHWEVRPAKRFFREVDVRSVTGEEELLSVSHLTGVTPRSEKNINMFMASSYEGYKLCQPGDLVLNTMWAWAGALGIAAQSGIVSTAYGVYRPHSGSTLSDSYAHQLLRTPIYVGEYLRRSTGIQASRLRLYPDVFLRMPVLCPPPGEQAAIVRFIDHADRLIRHYIAAKQKLITLLEEQREAISHQAVARGVRTYARFEDTGDPWFPRLPRGWAITSMGRVVLRAVDGPHHSPDYVDAGIPFISARNIKADEWSLEDAKYISQEDFEEFSKRVKPEPGDVLYTKGGTTGVARVVDLDFPFQVWVHVAVLKVDRTRVSPDYLALALNSPRCYEQAQLHTRGATNQDLGLTRMKRIVLPLPPLEEQEAIVASVESATASLRQAVSRSQKQIRLAKELRNRLISDVVTGKLDVRESAATLPEVVEDADELADGLIGRGEAHTDVPNVPMDEVVA